MTPKKGLGGKFSYVNGTSKPVISERRKSRKGKKGMAILAVVIFGALIVGGLYTFFVPPSNGMEMIPIAKSYNPELIKSAQKIGDANKDMEIYVSIALKLRNEPELQEFLKEVSNPSSPNYRHFLTHEQVKEKYSPPKDLYEDMVKYLRGQGLHIQYTYDLRETITIYDTIGNIEKAFDTQFGLFKTDNPHYNSEFFAATEPLKMPAKFTPYIKGIDGTSNARKFYRNIAWIKPLPPDTRFLENSTTHVQYMTGADLQKIYQVIELYNDSATNNATTTHAFPNNLRVATVLWEGYDIWSSSQKAPYNPANIKHYLDTVLPDWENTTEGRAHVWGHGTSGTVPPGSDVDGNVNVENELDLEMVATLAPGSDVVCVYGPGGATGGPSESNFPDNEYDYLANLNNMTLVAVSNSWGDGDSQGSSTTDNDIQLLESQGTTVVAASGDDGDTTTPSYISTDAYDNYGVTAVGGTTLRANGNPGSWQGYGIDMSNPRQNEIVWYDTQHTNQQGDHYGTQSGTSSVYAYPSWQSNYGVGDSSGRNTADVSAIANNTIIYTTANTQSGMQTGFFGIGGTSVASPVVAGILGAIAGWMQYKGYQVGLGFLNPTLYQIWNDWYNNGQYSSTPPFFDVTEFHTGTSYGQAQPGWDFPTGVGVINAWNFANIIASQNVPEFSTEPLIIVVSIILIALLVIRKSK